MLKTDSAVVWTAALMAMGSLAGDGRDDGWEYPDDGASSWSVAALRRQQRRCRLQEHRLTERQSSHYTSAKSTT